MRSALLLSASLLILTLLSFSQTQTPPADTSSPNAQNPSGFSVDYIDKSVDPCVDFNQYACGNWMKRVEIPGDEPEWVSFLEVNERNQKVLRDILEKAAAGGPGRDSLDQKIGDYYGARMDEHAADAKGLDPLKPELDRVTGVKDKAALIDAIAHVHLLGPNPLFNFYSSPDLHNADMVIAYIDQGGLTL